MLGPIYKISQIYHKIIISLSYDQLTIVTYDVVRFIFGIS